ncbi:MAG: helix-turn-helix domain-containing protein [Azovibrio sp.]|uniref:helix-turn-helix domain-containing protein n=1 Tax=Azovibrio sp. TaxID=1872673 RepID=UPI003C78036C
MTEPWVSVDQIAGHLGVTRDSIFRWIDRKGLPAHRVGRLWKFKVSEVDEWVRGGGADEEKNMAMLPRHRREKNRGMA